MLAMADINSIKYLREKKGYSISKIANIHNINWRTAKKYSDRDDWNIEIKKKKRSSLKDEYYEIISIWLKEDLKLPRKQRHTAQRVYERLVEEHNFPGSDRTVRLWVAEIKKELYKSQSEIYVKLSAQPGAAQADFGKVQVIEKGVIKQYSSLVLSFPYSNAAFTQLMPAENSECLQEALKNIFEFLGGTPGMITFDNLTAAVAKVKANGERELTESFQRFCLHYGFEPIFCNVQAANEKGNVENKVGYIRRNFFVPLPEINDLESFNRELLQKSLKYLDKTHYEKQQKIRDLFAKDQQQLKVLPPKPFYPYTTATVTVDKYGRIKHNQIYYYGIPAKPGESLLVVARWNTLTIYNSQMEVITEIPRAYKQKEVEIDWKAFFDLVKKKPKAFLHSTHYEFLPPNVKRYLTIEDNEQRKERLWQMAELLEEYTLQVVEQALTDYSEQSNVDLARIKLSAYKIASNNRTTPLPLAINNQNYSGFNPDLTRYERLLRGERENG
ncbi:hypothetical protein ciss_13770 [Carboxydothermus islandicus]|uniref:Integrase catalytic domain-containing protein n=1 Tax=Carboxydothermus islandicus TaxID=661089 RepID=A0A1L8D2W4_9THEO|nr:IS21 family transposase [Carboxydothermus islandicus]GAV25444.1 hypothetical protein ciss_13770 [Carboxydothermus islandicus]